MQDRYKGAGRQSPRQDSATGGVKTVPRDDKDKFIPTIAGARDIRAQPVIRADLPGGTRGKGGGRRCRAGACIQGRGGRSDPRPLTK